MFHDSIGHLGHEKLWIPQIRVLVRSILGRCLRCKRLNARQIVQQMAPLPRSRMMAYQPPFSYSGMDLFGPLQVKHGRGTAKRWCCLFTCLNTCAVHLELVQSMNTDDFIMCLRRFINRRGEVSELRCDRGSNENWEKRSSSGISRKLTVSYFSADASGFSSRQLPLACQEFGNVLCAVLRPSWRQSLEPKQSLSRSSKPLWRKLNEFQIVGLWQPTLMTQMTSSHSCLRTSWCKGKQSAFLQVCSNRRTSTEENGSKFNSLPTCFGRGGCANICRHCKFEGNGSEPYLTWSQTPWFCWWMTVHLEGIFKGFYDTCAKLWKQITWYLLRFWMFFIGGWIQFRVTVHVCHRTRMPWQNGRMSETTSWGRLCSQNPLHAYATPSKLSAILRVPLGNPLWAVSQKSRFFLVQQNFPLYTRGLLGCLLGFWLSYNYFPCPEKFSF